VFEWNAALADIVETHHRRRGLRRFMARVVVDAPEALIEALDERARVVAPAWLSMALSIGVASGLWMAIIAGVLALPHR
jgi:hypothetical protein